MEFELPVILRHYKLYAYIKIGNLTSYSVYFSIKYKNRVFRKIFTSDIALYFNA